MSHAAPLASVRVVDLGDSVGEAATRLLADLGAHVTKVEPPQGAPTRAERPVVDGPSLAFLTRNANKSGAVAGLHTDEGRAAATALVTAEALAFVTRCAADLLGVDDPVVPPPPPVGAFPPPFRP